MADSTVAFESIAELSRRMRAGTIKSATIVEGLLDRIALLDERLHSFIRVTPERALADARAADVALQANPDLGPLHGVPYAVKDLFDVKGMPTTAGTSLRASHTATSDCTAVKMLAAAGMPLLGKTHTIQFAFGMVGVNHDQGTPLNPWHSTPHAPGGSSSGSAVAVAAGLVPLALGTDTGGSVRLPAALCGIVGLKTTVGRISRAGVYPLSSTLDSVGVLSRSVEDAALAYHALQGMDEADATTLAVRPHDTLQTLKSGVRGLRIAFAETVFFDDVDVEIETAVRNSGEAFKALGANVSSVALPEAAEALSDRTRHLLIAAEGCAVNADLLDRHLDSLDPVVARRMIAGRSLAAPDYCALLRRRDELQKRIQRTLRDVDALLTPTSMIPALPLSVIDENHETYTAYNGKYFRNTGLGNFLNLCGISLPCGFTRNGSPIGLMIYCKSFHEDMALRVAYAYEQVTDWHAFRPDLAWAEAGDA